MAHPRNIVCCLLEEDAAFDPVRAVDQLPYRFELDKLVNSIMSQVPLSMDVPEEKARFLAWMERHQSLFPDYNHAVYVIQHNDAWCFDNIQDVASFLAVLKGTAFTDEVCAHCHGTGDDPDTRHRHMPPLLCPACYGSGFRPIEDLAPDEPIHCECDNTHQANDTVCRWCYTHGRRHWNDPEVPYA